MSHPAEDATSTDGAGSNRLTPMRFVLGFGVVAGLGDFVYEGARSVVGPYLATFGASAALVGLVTGAGEAVALLFRLVSGPLTDRTRRPWPITIAGYAITMVAVPLLAVGNLLWQVVVLVIGERFGKAVRSPAKGTMLAAASSSIGRGRAFAIQEALDQAGAVVGPLTVAAMVALSGYRLGFAVLAIPAVASLVVLAFLRRGAPHPEAYEQERATPRGAETVLLQAERPRLSTRFWGYSAFTALTMLGYATFAVLAFHLQVRHVVPTYQIPIIYAVAMGVDALAALASGWMYDRVGLRGLVVLPLLAAAVPALSFSTNVALVWTGAVVWGAAMGVHESTMKAAVADIVPASRRGSGYGIFAAVYGVAWLVGSAAIGALYDVSVTAIIVFTSVAQAVALVAFVPLVLRRTQAA
ncbi:MFS transporter [Flexivirga alba]|uniref:MFS transporter n=1 Tax=Flexivirga alba TaxID=702742 RepID=A0ABW2ACP8_9MICO